MRHDLFRKYLTNPRDFDGWLKANVLVGSIVAVAILTMALAALFSGGGSNQIELSSVGRVRAVRTDQAPCARNGDTTEVPCRLIRHLLLTVEQEREQQQ